MRRRWARSRTSSPGQTGGTRRWVARCCPATRQARRWDTPKRACRCTTALRRRFGGQKRYFSGSDANCAKLGTIAATVIAGPLNYAGVNPKVNCHVPQPSK
jgi:hypothetical protein